jgi:hypothetical protein
MLKFVLKCGVNYAKGPPKRYEAFFIIDKTMCVVAPQWPSISSHFKFLGPSSISVIKKKIEQICSCIE